jgi:hypothetical protein
MGKRIPQYCRETASKKLAELVNAIQPVFSSRRTGAIQTGPPPANPADLELTDILQA